MTSPKTLNDRVIEAKALASLSKIVSRDKHGRVSVVLVPGSEATRNQVIIRRFAGGIISCECRKEAGAHGYIPCNGNLKGVCRHSIAAVMVAMADQGYIPRFRKDLDNAHAFGKAHADEALTNPETGNPCIFTLKSREHLKNCLYMVVLETAVLELKIHDQSSWMGVPPEARQREYDSVDTMAARRTQLDEAELAGRMNSDDSHPGHPNHYGDFGGVR